jgi:regulator of telomere elongation helicase 1
MTFRTEPLRPIDMITRLGGAREITSKRFFLTGTAKEDRMRSRHQITPEVEVLFPFEKPYACQLDIMRRVVQCVQEGVNGLIESPTGTGKTLSIICAAVAALKHLKPPPSRIIYCTRTHSQISQVFEELKAHLPYGLRVSPFASRKHACIFENLPEQFPGNALNLSCRLLRKLNTIQQKMGRESSLKLVKKVVDVEDSVTIVKQGCPFFFGY